ncbi:YdeI/OmpD-associated family protein [Oleiharenicola lentus]|uniref:YdeI/OmpD-associated family protein n=1 Tax=Oleiharenicola lentus TaxID=2508720 RepID=UPI003F669E46
MPAKKDPRVDAYIATAAPFAQPILKHLRKLIHTTCPDVEETIKWSSPFFLYRGKLLCNFAAFKAHVAFGFWHQGMAKILTDELGKADDAMGLLGRITSVADLPDDKALGRYLRAALALHDTGVAPREKKPPRPELATPAEFAAALKRNKKAAAHWADFSPSARRDYLEWIIDAKRDETREQRIETTLEWVAEGKSRHWKYKNC